MKTCFDLNENMFWLESLHVFVCKYNEKLSILYFGGGNGKMIRELFLYKKDRTFPTDAEMS